MKATVSFIVAIPLAYALLFAFAWDRVGLKDHDQFLVFHELQYWNARLFSWEKQWTPLLGGGLSLAGDPQVPLLSLTMSLGYLLGPFAGLRTGTILYLALGWLGAYLYGSISFRRRTVRALAASLFIGNGFFVCRLGYGHIDHVPFLALPLVLWALHRAAGRRSLRSGALTALLLGGLFAVAVDGSPVAIVHWLLWIGIYAAALALVTRTPAPVLVLLGAVGAAALLDAGYLWPMLSAQSEFPRLRPPRFTNPAVLFWFLLVPARGKLIPAPANGHEFSVFIGPVVAWLIVRYRREAASEIPRAVWIPCLVTALVAFVLGMGSLRPLGVPEALSPFDLLSPLPGFRSLSVTGRYWGFLALPLAVLGAFALDRYSQKADSVRARAVLFAALALQLAFQSGTLGGLLLPSRRYRPVPVEWRSRAGADGLVRIEYVYSGDEGFTQGAHLTPTRGVIDCYNHGDFIRPRMKSGKTLVRSTRREGRMIKRTPGVDAGFLSWSEIVLRRAGGGGGEPGITLNQAWNRRWASSAGKIVRTGTGNLGVAWADGEAAEGEIRLVFRDPWSRIGGRVSAASWIAWIPALLLLHRRRRDAQG